MKIKFKDFLDIFIFKSPLKDNILEIQKLEKYKTNLLRSNFHCSKGKIIFPTVFILKFVDFYIVRPIAIYCKIAMLPNNQFINELETKIKIRKKHYSLSDHKFKLQINKTKNKTPTFF